MPTEQADKSLRGELALRELSRKAKLLELAKGQKMFTGSEVAFLIVIAALFSLVYLDRAPIPVGVFQLFLITVVLQVLHTTRVQRRLKAITELIDLQGRPLE